MPCSGSEQRLRFARTIDLLGEEGFGRLQQALVVVAGLGGVGSHAAVALARAGVGSLRIIDSDRITASSLNRHAVAGAGDIGRLKTEVLQEHLERAQPDVGITAMACLVAGDSLSEVLAGSPDMVIDAIDDIEAKALLLSACVERALPVISSMGASSRTDPSLIRVDDLSATTVCPLARQLRRRLRRHGIESGITAVFSCEPARHPLPPDESEQTARTRVRHRQPSLSTLPGIFGYTLANAAILHLSRVHLP